VTPNETPFDPGAFIRQAAWQAARAPFGGDPHEYVIRGRGTPPELHDAMCAFIQANGTPGEYEGRRYVYLEHDGYVLWVSLGIYEPRHPIINRRPVSEV
jgi:hypothetical protein